MGRVREQWEYHIENLPGYDEKRCTDMMKAFGNAGWEAYGLIPLGRGFIRIFLKRKKLKEAAK